jgi:hypothetical protein
MRISSARYRHKRDTQWTGYMVYVSETCEPTAPHLLTHVHTTTAAVHEALCTAPIQQALVEKDLPPSERLVDARCKWHGHGIGLKKGKSAISGEQVSKGRCLKAYVPLGCGMPDTEV